MAVLVVLTVDMPTVEFEVTELLFAIVVIPLTVLVVEGKFVVFTCVVLTGGAAVVVLFAP